MTLAWAGVWLFAGASGAKEPPEDPWEIRVAPYIWLPAATGDATVAGTKTELDSSLSDLFSGTDFVFGLQGEAEGWYRGRWGLLFNGQWSIVKVNDNLSGTPLESDLKMNMGLFELAAAYSFGERGFTASGGGPTWEIQPLVGARVTVMKLALDFDNLPNEDKTQAWADPILGARVRLRPSEESRWSWTMRGDFGGFGAGSDFTWNALGFLGYDFQLLGVRSTALLGARALYQDFDDKPSFGWDVTQYGPLLGLMLSF